MFPEYQAMTFADPVAAARLKELREGRGFSPEGLAADIKRSALRAPWGDRGCVDPHTIRRIERDDHVPSLRVQFVLAHYFGVTMRDIWSPAQRRPVQRRAAA